MEQPKIKIETTSTDIIVEVLGWAFLGFLWWLTASNYRILPDTIPVHYNIAGEIDDTGSKATILVLPLITTLLFIGLTILNRYPHIFNYPVKITEQNALRQYSNAMMLIRVLKLVIVAVFTSIAWFMIRGASDRQVNLGIWFLPVFLALVMIPMGVYLRSAFRKDRS